MYCVHSRVCFSIESLIMIRFCCGIMMTLVLESSFMNDMNYFVFLTIKEWISYC
jgi:hypothetical protein